MLFVCEDLSNQDFSLIEVMSRLRKIRDNPDKIRMVGHCHNYQNVDLYFHLFAQLYPISLGREPCHFQK